MNVRAVIFDIYHTLLQVGPPPSDAEQRWRELCRATLGRPPSLTLEEFGAACDRAIVREHAEAHARGVAFPEVFWPKVATEALSELTRLGAALDDFLFAHAQLQRTVRLMAGAPEVLKSLIARRMPLGLASNCQPYTLRELDAALGAVDLSRNSFAPDLCFFSFANGFSKPDPHVFRLLAARLRTRGSAPDEAFVVGDHSDNDVEPAKAQGFRTWRLTPAVDSGKGSGDWTQLGRFLASR